MGGDEVGGEDAVEAHQREVEVLLAALPQIVDEGSVHFLRWVSQHQFAADVERQSDLLSLSRPQLGSNIGADLSRLIAANSQCLSEETIIEVKRGGLVPLKDAHEKWGFGGVAVPDEMHELVRTRRDRFEVLFIHHCCLGWQLGLLEVGVATAVA